MDTLLTAEIYANSPRFRRRSSTFVDAIHDLPGKEEMAPAQLYSTESGRLFHSGRIVIATVGLPARGKTHTSVAIARYLRWLGVKTHVFHLGDYRRATLGPDQDVPEDYFFLNATPQSVLLRNKILKKCRDDIYHFLENEKGQVAIYDAVNAISQGRRSLAKEFAKKGIQTVFIESQCTDERIIQENVRRVKISSPDYKGWNDEDAVRDYLARINSRIPHFETMEEQDLHWIKMINAGERVHVNNCAFGYLSQRIVFYLLNLHIKSRQTYFARAGTTREEDSYKADADLSPEGHEYAKQMGDVLLRYREEERQKLIDQGAPDAALKPLTIWTSTRRRTVQTSEYLASKGYRVRQRSQMSQMNPGVCEKMSERRIREEFPHEVTKHEADPYHHRYPRAESYHDLAVRMEPIILELEREENDLLIIAHESVLRVLYGYLMACNAADIPKLEFPRDEIIESGNTTAPFDNNGTYYLSLGSRISFDFGVEVGGWISFNADRSTNTNTSTSYISLAFAESPAFVGSISDDTGATPTQNWDQALNVTLPEGSSFHTTPIERFRGGFRFLTISSFTHVSISNITCKIGFAPNTPNLRAYDGHFYTPDDDLLVRTWYAGAYTVQTNIAPKDTGRWLPQVRPGWAYNNSIGITGPLLVDGAKRDRAIWPGDLGIQGTTAFLALGHDGLESVYNALDTLSYYQNTTTGRFPFAGPATGSFRNGAQSDTYHAWSLIAMFNYAIWTSDQTWLETHWANITHGLEFILSGLNNEDGLHEQTKPNDWARQGGGGYNSALNALDYHALASFADLANDLAKASPATFKANASLQEQSKQWSTAAARLKTAFNHLLWDESASLYKDNGTTTLHPQDGNALALLYNLTTTPSQSSALSHALTSFHGPIGPLTPELPDTISPFVTSIEVLSHFAATRPSRALALTRSLWGYLLDSPLMTGSTLAEGLSANGSLYYRGNAGYKNDAAYTSLSHGWSTGPTVALTSHVGGLEIVAWRVWRFRPQSDGRVRHVQTGFESPMGGFAVQWDVIDRGNGSKSFDFEANVATAEGTLGTVELVWGCQEVRVDGEVYGGSALEGGGERTVRARGCVWDDKDE
ncbi:hypothetical protein N0V95_003367 [Ascochyta clinopodiicola]|nr:hypothetical protein N0V95_003367 [Ascochyta clinopodiicola]